MSDLLLLAVALLVLLFVHAGVLALVAAWIVGYLTGKFAGRLQALELFDSLDVDVDEGEPEMPTYCTLTPGHAGPCNGWPWLPPARYDS